MGTATFEIESYQIAINQQLDSYTKTIKLLSTNQSHGIRFDATLLFLSKNPYKAGGAIGQVSNFGAANFNPVGLAIWVDMQNFESFYQVLCNEKPVFLTFGYATNETISDVTTVRLSTNSEMPGDFEKPVVISMPPKS